jgi:hypothetical protein
MACSLESSPLLPQLDKGILYGIGGIVSVARDAFGQREHLVSQGRECASDAVGLLHCHLSSLFNKRRMVSFVTEKRQKKSESLIF